MPKHIINMANNKGSLSKKEQKNTNKSNKLNKKINKKAKTAVKGFIHQAHKGGKSKPVKVKNIVAKSSKKEAEIPHIKFVDPIHKNHKVAEATARHYGFVPFSGLSIQKEDLVKAKGFKITHKVPQKDEVEGPLNFENFLEDHIAITRAYLNKEMTNLVQPPMLCYSGPLAGNPHFEKLASHGGHGSHTAPIFSLQILANPKSIADAMIIETAYLILKEQADKGELLIEINSLGDKDSFAKFTREYINYFKKNLNTLPTTCRTSFKKDPLSMLNCEHEVCLALQEGAPKPINYLTEEGRDHFKEVLEYIESLNLPYMINHNLIGSGLYAGGTVFQITAFTIKGKLEKKEVLAIGERYNSVSKKAWGKKDVPAVGAYVLADSAPSKRPIKMVTEKEIKFYFIHLGYDAKLKSLTILEMLRIAKIPVHQALAKDKFTGQLAAAEKMGVPYILILGQKEAIENSVTVRHMSTRVQETIHVDSLIEYLKKLL